MLSLQVRLVNPLSILFNRRRVNTNYSETTVKPANHQPISTEGFVQEYSAQQAHRQTWIFGVGFGRKFFWFAEESDPLYTRTT